MATHTVCDQCGKLHLSVAWSFKASCILRRRRRMILLKLGQSMQHQLMTSAFSPPSMSPSTTSPAGGCRTQDDERQASHLVSSSIEGTTCYFYDFNAGPINVESFGSTLTFGLTSFCCRFEQHFGNNVLKMRGAYGPFMKVCWCPSSNE